MRLRTAKKIQQGHPRMALLLFSSECNMDWQMAWLLTLQSASQDAPDEVSTEQEEKQKRNGNGQ
jgi:hypothetical protein